MDLLVLSGGGPSGDKTAGARLLVADPERSVGDCSDEVLTGFGKAPGAAAAAADLGKGLGSALLLAGGSRGPSEGDILPELDFAACPKNSLRPDCWEAGLDMREKKGKEGLWRMHLTQSCARESQRRAKVWGNADACRVQQQLRCIAARTVSAAAAQRHYPYVVLPCSICVLPRSLTSHCKLSKARASSLQKIGKSSS